jgi:hypothetical protein
VPRSWDIAAELRDQCLNQEIFYSLMEAQVVVEHWRNEYNAIRPHSSLGYRPPAPQATERRRTVARSAIPARKRRVSHSRYPSISTMRSVCWPQAGQVNTRRS